MMTGAEETMLILWTMTILAWGIVKYYEHF